MEKRADLQELLSGIGASLKEKGQALASPLEGLSENQQELIRNALIGGLAGGVGTGALGAAAGEGAVGSALPGLILGALAGGGGTAGYQYLTGSEKLKGEPGLESSWLQELSDPAMTGILQNPGKAVGTGAGLAYALSKTPGAHDYTAAAAGIGDKATRKSVEEALRKINLDDPSKWDVMKESLRGPASMKSKVRALLDAAWNTPTKNQLRAEALGGHPLPKGRNAWAAVPIGLTAGYLVDRYLKGDY